MKELIRRPKVYKLYGDKKEDGKKFVMESKYAVVLLAGGQGSRLEVKGAKGKYNVPFTSGKIKSIFEIQAKKLQKLNVLLYVMVSTDNEKDTKEFFKENKNFGLNVNFFIQSNLPLKDLDGEDLKIDGKKVYASSGHGDVVKAIQPLIPEMEKNGIERVMISNIDNILSTLVDVDFIGESIDNDLVLKVVEKEKPDEKVGVFVLDDNNRLKCLEYSEIPENLREMRDNMGLYYNLSNIMVQIISIKALKNLSKKNVPIHLAYKKKKIEGKIVEFIKQERFLFDYYQYIDNFKLFMVLKERNFAPIKDLESVDNAVKLYEAEMRRTNQNDEI